MRPRAANIIAILVVVLFAGCDSGGPETTTPSDLEIATPSTRADAADRETQRKLEAAYRAMEDAAAETPPITTGRQLAGFLQRKAPEAQIGGFAFVENQDEVSSLILGIGDPFNKGLLGTTVIVPPGMEGKPATDALDAGLSFARLGANDEVFCIGGGDTSVHAC